MSVAAALLVVAGHRGLELETDIRAAFGGSSADSELDAWVDEMVSASLDQTLVLIGHQRRDELRQAIQAADRWLASQAVLQPMQTPAALWADPALRPHAGHLLTTADLEDLQQQDADAWVDRALRRLHGPTGGLGGYGVTEDLFGTLGRFAASRWPAGDVDWIDGLPVVRGDGHNWGVLRLRSSAGGFGLAAAATTVDALDALKASIGSAVPDVQLLELSISRHADTAAQRSQSEMSRIGTVSLLAIGMLLGGLFLHPAPLLLTAASVGSGLLLGLAAVVAVFDTLHLIALVFGATLIGVAVDYAFHLFLAQGDAQARVRAIRPGVTLGWATTCIAFAGLMLAPFQSLQQVAVFSVAGLSGAYITVFALLADWPGLHRWQPRPAAMRLAHRLLASERPKTRWGLLFGMLAAAAAMTGLGRLAPNDDLRAMYYSAPTLLAEARRVQALVGGVEASQMLVLRADDQEALLQALEQVGVALDRLQGDAVVTTVIQAGRSLPSLRRQQVSYAAMETTLYAPGAALDRLAARLQAPSQWVDARRAAFHASRPLTFDRWQALTAATPHAGLIRPLDQGWGALIRLGGVSDLPRLQQMVTRQRDAGLDLQWLDTVAQAEASLAAARRDATRVLLLAAMVAGLILVVRYGLLRAAVVAVPPGLAVAVTLGLCGWAQAGFSVFRLFALLLVLGLAIDYAVFAAETVRDRQRTLVAIVLSMLTTLLAFGLLGLSATPALAEFGATVVCGVLVAFVSTLGLWRAGWLGAR